MPGRKRRPRDAESQPVAATPHLLHARADKLSGRPRPASACTPGLGVHRGTAVPVRTPQASSQPRSRPRKATEAQAARRSRVPGAAAIPWSEGSGSCDVLRSPEGPAGPSRPVTSELQPRERSASPITHGRAAPRPAPPLPRLRGAGPSTALGSGS